MISWQKINRLKFLNLPHTESSHTTLRGSLRLRKTRLTLRELNRLERLASWSSRKLTKTSSTQCNWSTREEHKFWMIEEWRGTWEVFSRTIRISRKPFSSQTKRASGWTHTTRETSSKNTKAINTSSEIRNGKRETRTPSKSHTTKQNNYTTRPSASTSTADNRGDSMHERPG